MSKKTILLVDDEDAILSSIGWALENSGFAVTTAQNGLEAVNLLLADPYDLVVTDLLMDKVDGVGVLRHAKSLYPDIGVIILTGYGNIDSAVKALKMGADDYLQKPCDVDDLINKIQRAFERQDLTVRLHRQNEQLKQEIAARKTAEKKLERSRADLENTVAKRTAELSRTVGELQGTMQKLCTRERELQEKNRELQDINTALNVLLKRREDEQSEMRKEIAVKTMQTVLPLIRKAEKQATGAVKGYVEMAKANLLEVFAQQSRNGLLTTVRLAPRELQVINYIKQNKTSKEIADLLGLSLRTVESYREKIRKKLGIKREKKNLKKFILSHP